MSPALPATRTFGLSWPLLVWLAALSALALGDSMLLDPDTYWHIATGNWILEHRRVPNSDPFSHSMSGVPWTAHEWLTQAVFAAVHAASGWSGLVALTALLFASTLAVLMRFLLRYLEPVHALMFLVLTAGMLRPYLLARPHMVAVPLLALWLAGLVIARDRNEPPPLALLPLMALWANVHGSFTLGLALAGALGLEAVLAGGSAGWRAAAWQWGRFIVLAVIAAMLTPSHWKGLAFTFHVMNLGNVLAVIGEWRSLDFQNFHVFELWLLVLLAVALAGRLRLPIVRLLVIVGMVHLSLKHGRYTAVTGIVAPFLMAAPFARHWYAAPNLGSDAARLDRVFAALAQPAHPLAVGGASVFTALVLAGAIATDPYKPYSRITPSAALAALNDARVRGPVFNSYNFGGYLIYAGVPVFIDGRADMYGEEFFKRYVSAIQLKKIEDLTDLLDEFHIEAAIVEAGTPVVTVLDLLPGWKRLHADETAVVHVRSQQPRP